MCDPHAYLAESKPHLQEFRGGAEDKSPDIKMMVCSMQLNGLDSIKQGNNYKNSSYRILKNPNRKLKHQETNMFGPSV